MNEEPQSVPLSPPEKYPFWTYRDVLVLGSLAVPLLAISIGLVGGVTWAVGWKPAAKAAPLLISQFIFYSLWLAFLYAWFKVRYGRPFWRSLAWAAPQHGLFGSFVWGIFTAVFVITFGALLGPPQTEMPLVDLLRDRSSLIWMGVFAITLGPLWEELAFRGFLLPLLMRSLRAIPGILLTAMIFAGMHGPEYAWSWKHLVLVSAAGVAFGWMRYRSGSTAMATVMHSGYNLVFFLGMVWQKFPQK